MDGFYLGRWKEWGRLRSDEMRGLKPEGEYWGRPQCEGSGVGLRNYSPWNRDGNSIHSHQSNSKPTRSPFHVPINLDFSFITPRFLHTDISLFSFFFFLFYFYFLILTPTCHLRRLFITYRNSILSIPIYEFYYFYVVELKKKSN